MTELTHEQANSMLAEKAMGWKLVRLGRCEALYYQDINENNIIRAKDWNPTTNTDHALQALEAWLANVWRYNSCHTLHWSVWIDDMNYGKKWRSNHKDRTLAECQALCSAISGEQVRIV